MSDTETQHNTLRSTKQIHTFTLLFTTSLEAWSYNDLQYQQSVFSWCNNIALKKTAKMQQRKMKRDHGFLYGLKVVSTIYKIQNKTFLLIQFFFKRH